MTGLLLRWRVPAPAISLRWRGPAGALPAIASQPAKPLAAFVVPPAVLPVAEGDGIDVVGNEIRVGIESLPSG
jgi:hypothetical protein